jgi:hypothetical protein
MDGHDRVSPGRHKDSLCYSDAKITTATEPGEQDVDHSTGNFHIGSEEIAASIRFQDLVDALAGMYREAPAIIKDMLLEQPGREGPDHLLVRARLAGR